MNLNPKTVGDVLILQPSEKITMANCEQLRDQFLEYVKKGRRKLALDLSHVDYMDSAGLAALVEIVKIGLSDHLRLRFFAIQSQVRSLMEVAHLHDVFPLAESEAEALEALQKDA